MDGSIGSSTTQSVGNYPESLFTFQNKFLLFLEHRVIFFSKKIELYELKEKNRLFMENSIYALHSFLK